MSADLPTARPLQLFYSYAPEDEALCQELEKHLSLLKRQGIIIDWHPRNIGGGMDREREIDFYLNAADIILLLISADFLASEYCYSFEIKKALERHAAHQARVVPIILRPVDLGEMPFAHLQSLPTNYKPVVKWTNRDEAFLHISQGIRKVADELRQVSPDSNLSNLTPLSQKMYKETSNEHIKNKTLSKEVMQQIIPNVFHFNQRLPSQDEFYGRKRERMVLLDRVRKGESTSIVGSRRIGKTWLMQYLQIVAPKDLRKRFIIGYLDITMKRCDTVTGFATSALEVLTSQKYNFANDDDGLLKMEQIVQELQSNGQVPVLCIDEFEGFAGRPVFGLDFFTTMRAMSQEGLCLVVASKAPLIKIVGEKGKTSGFFNIFEQRKLLPFNLKDAEQFTQSKGDRANLEDLERQRIMDYGQVNGEYWPLRLQLVGKMLLDDKNLALKENEPDFYRPTDSNYWQDFKNRLEEIYRGTVSNEVQKTGLA